MTLDYTVWGHDPITPTGAAAKFKLICNPDHLGGVGKNTDSLHYIEIGLAVRLYNLNVLICLAILFARCVTDTAVADTRSAETWFNSLVEQQRFQLQFGLTWTGEYAALIDGVFGEQTYKALVEFDAKSGGQPDGVLTEVQIQELQNRVGEEQRRLTMEQHSDPTSGLTYWVPKSVVSKRISGSLGDTWKSDSGDFEIASFRVPYSKSSFRQTFDNLTRPSQTRNVLYSTIGPTFFAISGILEGKSFYLFAFSTDKGSAGISVIWPVDQKDFRRVALGVAGTIDLLEGKVVQSAINPGTRSKTYKQPSRSSDHSDTSETNQQDGGGNTTSTRPNSSSAVTGWIDTSGLNRPEIEFAADQAGCQMYAQQVYFQSINQQQQVNPQAFGQSPLITFFGIAGSIAVKKKAYNACMLQHFWVHQ